ncbi:MAG: ice-binding family protein [Tenuifilaceae bacterium]|nr:ice-binding family protein [Tenuifilaceae bacterium]
MLNKTISTEEKKSPKRKQRRFLGFFITPLMTLLLLTVIMSQCKKDDFTGEVVGVCPIVLSTNPIDEAINVPLNQVITATFNENMDPTTLDTTSFVVMQGTNRISGTVASLNAKTSGVPAAINAKSLLSQGSNPISAAPPTTTFAFTPKTPLAPSTLYTATIKKGVRDPMNNALQKDHVWSFTSSALLQYAVTLTSNPTAGGTTTGAGSFNIGTSVTVKAVPATGYTFTNWTEGVNPVSTDAEYIFTINANRALVANFTAIGLILNVTAVNGTVVKNPNQPAYNNGDNVILTPTPNSGYVFTSWTGDATGNDNPLTVLMNANKNITANFTAIGLTLNVTAVNGVVVKNPDQPTYTNGDNVILTPTPNSGYVFTSWTGDATGNDNPLTVLMDANKNITANFTAIGLTLNVTAVNGVVVKNPDQPTYTNGDNVILTPTSNSGYEFTSWSGDATGNDNPLTVLMDANKNITANFTLKPPVGPGIVDLGTAGDFVILSKSGVSVTGVTSITGNVGVSPMDQTGLTGFSQIMDVTNTFSTSSYVTGKIYAADYTPPTPAYLTTAISDQETALTTAMGLTTNVIVDLGAGDISGMTLAPGLYKWGTGLLITNAGVTLDGGPNDTWVFQISSDFTINNNAIITLAGGAQAKNIFWITNTQALLGSNVQFKGNILAQTLISVNTGTTVLGRFLSQTAVTLLDQSVVVKP